MFLQPFLSLLIKLLKWIDGSVICVYIVWWRKCSLKCPMMPYGIVTCMHTCCRSLLLFATSTNLPSICHSKRPHVLISALSMHLSPVQWAWTRAPATHILGAQILTALTLLTCSTHPAFPLLCNCTVLPVPLSTGPYLVRNLVYRWRNISRTCLRNVGVSRSLTARRVLLECAGNTCY